MASQSRHSSVCPEFTCYCALFDRYIKLGTDGHFEERNREFRSRKNAAPIFGKSEKGLDHMIEDGRVASIKVGGTVLIHVPTSYSAGSVGIGTVASGVPKPPKHLNPTKFLQERHHCENGPSLFSRRSKVPLSSAKNFRFPRRD